ncbi:hypothetical protein ACNKU7_04560 [Microbulbifer sp. SA54]|uniref:hypothetical protein n=1 Tax=Microbulbifer sp. SA54 TaxID=3401577 RepID=UPI003AACC095
MSLTLLSACAQGTASGEQNDTKEAKDFRKYATAICLGSSFKEESVIADANRSANVYLGNVDLAAYETVRTLLKSWKPNGFTTKQGPQAAIARCIEFSESDAVHNVFRQFDPCTSADAWLDPEDFKAQCK